ncbi:GNAT family N-acetyltransferase [Salegentibacter chungangensis]|uniref:GNAT family N-acetyltransferase n=1 Tax=Salegentibacter chungangensis TaxID=1335724 RepID=A0ABW3NTM9_9FLAO
MKVKSLEKTDSSEIITCFLKAFENYYIQFPTDPDYFRKRWRDAGVRYDLSYGMFDGDKLVGFIIHAVDHRVGKLTAHNTGTGVLPEYRGRKFVDKIYEFAIPDLRRNGIKKTTLEVVTKNTSAIKVYKRTGFSISKTYKCFKGSFFHKPQRPEGLTEVLPGLFDWSLLADQSRYSWDNHRKSIQNGNYKFFILGRQIPLAAFIINPETGYIPQVHCLKNDEKTWEDLFEAIASVSSEIKINNVDIQEEGKIRQLKRAGLINHIDQFEMERII